MEMILFLGAVVHLIISGVKKLRTGELIKKDNKTYIPKQLGILLVVKDFLLTPVIFLSLSYFITHPQYIYSQSMWISCYTVMSLFIVMSIVLKFWAYRECSNKWSSGLNISKDHFLVTTGPYTFVRHPVYISYALAGFACISSGNVWMMILAGVFFWINFKRAQVEDTVLRKKFDNKYLIYIDEVGGFIPYGLRGGLIVIVLIIWCVLLITSAIWKIFH